MPFSAVEAAKRALVREAGGEGVPRLVAKVRPAVKKVPAFFGVLRDTGGADDGRRGTPDAGRNPLAPLDS